MADRPPLTEMLESRLLLSSVTKLGDTLRGPRQRPTRPT